MASGVDRLRKVVGNDAIKSGTKKVEEQRKKSYVYDSSGNFKGVEEGGKKKSSEKTEEKQNKTTTKQKTTTKSGVDRLRSVVGRDAIKSGTQKAEERVKKTYTVPVSHNATKREEEGVTESNLRDATLKDVTINSIKQGYYNSRYGQESYYDMIGSANEKQKYEDILAVEDYQFKPKGWLEEAVSGAANLLGQQARQWSDPRALTMAGGAAGAAAIAGQMGPQIAAPEEIITVPAAALAGLQAGSALSNFEIEAGFSYNELIENGVSEDTAKKIALAVGTGNAALELVQLDELAKSFKVLKKSGASKTATSMILEELAKRGLDVGTETLQEVGQEGITIAGTQVGSKLDKGEWAYSAEEVKDRLDDTAVSSALSFGFMNIPAATTNISRNIADSKQQIEQEQTTEKQTQYASRPTHTTTMKGTVAENETVDPDGALRQAAAEMVAGQTETSRQAVVAEIGSQTNVNPQVGEVSRNARKTVLTEEQKAERAYRNDELYRQAVMSLGDNGAKALGNTYDSKNNDFDSFYAGFSRYYEAGASDLKFESVKTDFARNIAPEVRYAAWTAGQNDRAETLKIEQENAKYAKVYGDDAGFVNDISVEVDKQTADVLNTLGKAVGAKIAMKETVFGGQANGSYQNGVISIASDTQNPIFVVAKHEVTHRMQEMAPTEYRAYRDYAVRLASRFDEVSEMTLVERYKSMAADNDVNLTTEQAMDEIAADFTEKILRDEKELRDFVGNNDKTVVQKFFDAVREFIDKVKKAFKGNKAQMDRASFEAFGATVAELERAEKLWKDTLKATEQRVKQGAKDSSVTEATMEQAEATELSDKYTMFSLRTKEPPKKTIIAYKAFYAYDGKLYPPMVANLSETERNEKIKGGAVSGTLRGNDTPVGVWIDADVGGIAIYTKDVTAYDEALIEAKDKIRKEYKKLGRKTSSKEVQRMIEEEAKNTREVQNASKEEIVHHAGDFIRNTKGRLAVQNAKGGGTLAFRPGWHLGEWPDAKQFNKDSKVYGKKSLMPDGLVFAKCEIAADVDYQLDAMEYGVSENGNFNRSQAGLPRIPENGFYKYRTNVDPTTAPWYITGSMRVTEILDDDDCARICAEFGVTPDRRESGKKINLADYGLRRGPVEATTDLEPYRKNQKNIENEALLEKALTDPEYEYAYKPGKLDFNSSAIAKEFDMNKQDAEYYKSEYAKRKPKTQYSLKDSSGRELTKEQAEFFKDSKVRDENGNLKVMYHGSERAGFHVFDPSYSDDGISLFFVDSNDVAKSYSGSRETYVAKTMHGADDLNNFFAEIGMTEYEAVEEDGRFLLMEDGDEVADSDTAAGLYEEFCIWTGVGNGAANYEVYLNLTNPLEVDAEGNEWHEVPGDLLQESYDRISSLSEAERNAITKAAKEILYDEGLWKSLEVAKRDGHPEHLASAYDKLKPEDMEPLFVTAYYGGFTESNMRKHIREFMATRDHAKKAKERGHDGVIFKNIVDIGVYGNVIETATVAIAFDSNQVKSVANKKPTSDPDIRFSLKKPVEETKNLIAVHNVYLNKIQEALKLGGLPGPSIAITKNDMQHDKYGEISLVFRKDTINPSDRRNKVYSSDAWTPTRVRVGYEVSDDVVQSFNKKIEELTPEWKNERYDRLPSVDAGTAEVENDSLAETYRYKDRARFAFLREKGKAPRVVTRDPKLSGFVSNDTIIAVAKAFTTKQLKEIANTSNGYDQYRNALLKVVRDNEWNTWFSKRMGRKLEGELREAYEDLYSSDNVSRYNVEDIARKAGEIKSNKYKIAKEIDGIETKKVIDKKFTPKLEAEFKAWVDENTKGAILNKGIRNNKDTFDNRGNRRSFNQLHDTYNLSNIVKNMFAEADKGVGFMGGSVYGAAQREYSSITDIKADSDRLRMMEEDEFNDLVREINDDALELAERMKMNSDAFAVRDILTEAIGKSTKKQADSYLRRELSGWAKYSPEYTDELWEIRDRVLNLPTGYFEAKPQRAVGFHEVVSAVIPKGQKELRQQLLDAGVQSVKYYDPKVEGDRLKKINSVPDIAFSMKGQSDLLKENARLKEYNDYLKDQMKVTKFAKQNPKAVEKLAKGLLREYGSDLDQAELTEQLNDVYDYMANGTDANGAPAWNELKLKARKVARDILKNVTVQNDELYQAYKGLRDHLRTHAMSISEEDRADLPDNYNDFRKANFGRLLLSNEGTPVDRAYQQLAELYPEFFDADQYTHPADQLAHIVEVLDSLAPVEENPYSYNMNEATEWLANDIVDRFFEIPQKKPTFADKAETKLTKQKIKDADRLARLREQKNQQIERIRQQSRDRISQAIQKEKAAKWDKVEQVKEKQKQKEARMSDSRKRKAKVQQIVRHVNELSKKLNRPSDKHHVPEELRATVAAMLEAINLESQYTLDPNTVHEVIRKDGKSGGITGKHLKDGTGLPTKRTQEFLKLKEQYAKIVEESGMVVDPSLLGGEGVQGGFDAVIAMGNIRLADMSMAQLETVWKVLRAVEHSITTADKTLSYAKFQRTSEWAADIYNDTETRKSKKGRFIEKLRVDLENPYTFFSHFGDAGKDVFRMLRQAQDNQQSMVNEVRNEVKKIVTPKQVREFEKQVHEFKTERGDKLTLTTAHVMELYELMKRQQSHDHLLQGGIVQPAIKAKKIKRGNDSVLLTINDISKIVNVLTDEQIAIADGLQKLLTTTLSDYGNEASMKAYGYKKFTGKDYWPIKSAKEGIHSNIEKGAGNTRSIKNIGMAQQVIPHANNALDLGGLFQTFSNHAADMIDYSAWLCPMEDAQRLYNFKFREEDGTQTGKTMKGLLNTVGGAGSEQYWHRLMEDIQNGLSPVNDSAFLEPINKVIGNVKGASVGANIRVIVQQPTAILRAAMVLSPQDMIAGMTHGGGWKTALKYSAIAQRKDMGGFDISNPMMMNEILFDTKDKLQRFNEAMMWGAGKADAVTWGRIWNACEHKVKRESPHLSGDSFYKEVDRLFTEVIDSSQVVDGVLQRSQTMRSGNAIMKQATAFMGEPTMALNMLMRAYDGFVNETDGKKRTAARKTFGRTAMVLLVTNAVNALAQSLVDAYRDDEDEEYWDKFWSAFTGLSGDEESLWDKANAAVLSGNLGSSLNPVGYIPVAKDMISILQGYNVTRADADVMGDIMNAAKTFTESAFGDGKKTLGYATKNLAQQVGKVFGVSAPNILRDVWGIARQIANETDNVELMYEMEKAIYKADNTSNKGRFIDILYKAYSEGDMVAYRHILEDMISNGVPASSIESGMKSRAKKEDVTVDDLDYNAMSVGIKPTFVEEEEEAEEEKYTVDNLSGDGYIEFTEMRGDMLDEIVSDFKSHGFEDWDDETAQALIGAAYTYANSVALQEASGGLYEEKTKWIGNAQDAEYDLGLTIAEYLELREEYGSDALTSEDFQTARDRGMDAEMYLDIKRDTKDIDAKDENGESVSGLKKERVREYLLSVPGLSTEDYHWFMQEVFNYKKY